MTDELPDGTGLTILTPDTVGSRDVAQAHADVRAIAGQVGLSPVAIPGTAAAADGGRDAG